jgi:hypothetical protein
MGFAYGFWASLRAMEPIYLVLLVLAVITLTVLLINGIRAYFKYGQERLMNRVIRVRGIANSFTFHDAAEILVRSFDEKLVVTCFRTLKDLADSEVFKFENPNEQGKAWQHSRITKAELLRIAPQFGRDDPFN